MNIAQHEVLGLGFLKSASSREGDDRKDFLFGSNGVNDHRSFLAGRVVLNHPHPALRTGLLSSAACTEEFGTLPEKTFPANVIPGESEPLLPLLTSVQNSLSNVGSQSRGANSANSFSYRGSCRSGSHSGSRFNWP
jgi:hypothetical protein